MCQRPPWPGPDSPASSTKHPPPGLTQEQIDRLIECIEAPWGVRIERQIRECLDGRKGAEASVAIAARVKELGLEPFKPAAPLPPIGEDEIRLVCWLRIDNAQNAPSSSESRQNRT